MSKKLIRKRVGKPTGKTTKAGRPVYETETGERRSEYSSTIKLDNGKWINIPSIHNGKYYSDKELKEAVEDNRMIPTSEHGSEKEAIKSAMKRSKNLKQGGLLKAHQGTIVDGQIKYEQVSAPPSDPDPFAPPKKPFEVPQQIAVKPDVGLPNPYAITEPSVLPNQGKPDPAMVAISNPNQYPDLSTVSHPYMGDPSQVPVKTEILPEPVKQIPNNVAQIPETGQDYFKTEMPKDTGGNKKQISLADMEAQFKKAMENRDSVMSTQPSQQQQQNMQNYMNSFQQFQQQLGQDKSRLEGMESYKNVISAGDKFSAAMDAELKPFHLAMALAQQQYNQGQIGYGDVMKVSQDLELAAAQAKQKHSGLLGQAEMASANFNNAKWKAFNEQYKPVGLGQSIGKLMAFNEGGTVMDKQMEMNFGDTPIAELAEGGMKDDGGGKDPVSGNDVPSGATAKEVRDDVPAMVSEGEFIFPADVTRYIGLDRLMELRQDAKMGLKKMEMMGQLGDPEDAVLPDDIPFDENDIIIEIGEEEVEERNQGGIVGFAEGTANAGEQGRQPQYNIQEEANKAYSKKYTWYKNAAGEMKSILTDWRGNPLEPVPEGYKIMLNEDGSPVTKKPEKAPDDDDLEETQPTQPMEQKKDDDDKPDPAKVAEQNRESAKITADRLGFESVDDYLALSFKDRMKLVGEEFRVMGGGEINHDRVQGILDGSIESGFDGGILGGVFGMIGSIFDRDNDGSMWTSTDKDGNVRNIFGTIIDTIDVAGLGILKDGRWTGPNAPKKKKNKGTGTSTGNALTGELKTPTAYDPKPGKKRYERDDTYGEATNLMRRGDLTTSGRTNRGTTSAVRKAQSDRVQAGLSGQGFASGKFKQKKDQGDKGIAAETFTNEEKSRKRQATTKDSFSTPEESERKKQSTTRKKNPYEDDTGAAMINKGTLVTKRSTTKKPTTQRKALVGKY